MNILNFWDESHARKRSILGLYSKPNMKQNERDDQIRKKSDSYSDDERDEVEEDDEVDDERLTTTTRKKIRMARICIPFRRVGPGRQQVLSRLDVLPLISQGNWVGMR
jgi:hypothetical protein